MVSENRRSILKKVFSTKPANSTNSYIKSYAFDRRYLLSTGGKLDRQPVTLMGGMRGWLKNLDSLGDYEKIFVRDILNAPARIIAYRSGTGSGKSSLVLNIEAAMLEFAKRNKWKEALFCKSFVSVVDLQAADAADIGVNARLDDEQNSDERIEHHDFLLFGLLLDKLTDSLWELCSPENIKEILNRLDNNNQYNKKAPYRALLRELRANLSDDAGLLYQKLDTFLAHLNPKQAVDVVLHLYLYIGHIHKSDNKRGDHAKSFVLFIDNSDKLHHVALTRLINHLKEFNARTEHLDSDLKIALFLRLSTSKDQIGAIAEADYRYYSSPEPKDIVLYKAIDFILSDSKDHGEFSKTDIIQAKFAVLELLIELLDESIMDFSNSLEAISGTNIRNAFTHVITWCDSDELVIRTGGEEQLQSEIEAFVKPFFVNELRAIVRKFNNYLKDSLPHLMIEHPFRASKRISTNLSRIFDGYVSDSDRADGGINHRLRRFLVDQVASNPSELNGMATAALDDVQILNLNEIVETAASHFGSEGKEILSDIVKQCVENASFTIDSGEDDNQNVARRKMIWNYLQNILKLTSSEDQPHEGNVDKKHRLPARSGGQNRFERTLMLYDVESDEEESSLRPVNLISIDERKIQTCSLRIIYDLCEQQDSTHSAAKGVKYDTLRSKLKAYGYKKKEIRESMRLLTDLSTRLIYSRVADHHYYSETDWERRFFGKSFFISWAGYKYYQSLLSNPTFVQWMLINTSIIQSRFSYDYKKSEPRLHRKQIDGRTDVQPLFIENVQNVVDGYQVLLEYESGHLARMSDADAMSIAHICKSPVIDLMHRSCLPLIRTIDYVEDIKQIDENKIEKERFNDVKFAFLNTLEQGQEICVQYFGSNPARWSSIYEQARQIISK